MFNFFCGRAFRSSLRIFLFCYCTSNIAVDFASASRVAVCSFTTKVLATNAQNKCNLDQQIICDTTEIYGLKFPIGTELKFHCDIKEKKVTLTGALLAAELKIGSDLLSQGSEIYFGENPPELFSITFGEKQMFRGRSYGKGVTIQFSLPPARHPRTIFAPGIIDYENKKFRYLTLDDAGNLLAFSLAEDSDWGEFYLRKDADVRLFLNGKIERAELAKEKQIGSWKIVGPVFFHPNGALQTANLASTHEYQGAKISGEVLFTNQGVLLKGHLAEAVTRLIDAKTCHRIFYEKGSAVGFGDEGAKLWPRWYPSDQGNCGAATR